MNKKSRNGKKSVTQGWANGLRSKKQPVKRKMGKVSRDMRRDTKKDTVDEAKGVPADTYATDEQNSPEKKRTTELGETFTSRVAKDERKKEQDEKPQLPHAPQTTPLEEHHEVVKT